MSCITLHSDSIHPIYICELLVLMTCNSPAVRLYEMPELSSFHLQSVCVIKIHRRHVMSYFMSRNSVRVIVFLSAGVWKHLSCVTELPYVPPVSHLDMMQEAAAQAVNKNECFQTPALKKTITRTEFLDIK